MLDLAAIRTQAIWQRGLLSSMLHTGQLDMQRLVEGIQQRGLKKGVVRTGRRYGKTFYLAVLGIATCLRKPGARVAFIAPTVKSLKTIILPIFNQVLQGCPTNLRPEYKKQDGVYVFPNGSEIHLAGTDNGHADKIRGTKADLVILDEAGFMTDLKYVVNDICLPTLMYGDGFLLAASTPPTSPDHYFVEMLMQAELQDAAIHKTIWDNPMLSSKDVLDFAEAVGCKVDWDSMQIVEKSIAFRREFEAEILVDPESAVVPEFTEEKAKAIVKEWKLPTRCNKYVIIDTGYIDFTAVIFGYWDFHSAKAVVDDDMLIKFNTGGMNTEQLARVVCDRARSLWGDQPYLCHGDGDLIVLHELSRHGLPCSPVRKDVLEAQVNSARIDIQNEKVVINPRARNTIAHIKYAVWNKRRNAFDRTEDHGHYDCLAAFIYFLRHVSRNSNPYPPDWQFNVYEQTVQDGHFDRDRSDIRAMLNHGRRPN